MKYYVYISDTKLEMLYAQTVKPDNQQREATLGFDLAILKGQLKESRGLPDNKFSRLEQIIKSLEKESLIGGIKDKTPYIKETLEMTWASFGFSPDSPVTFWGYFNKDLFLGLAGSRHHVLGEQADGKTHSHSLTPSITRWLLDNFGDIPDDVRDQYQYSHNIPAPLSDYDICNATTLAIGQANGEKKVFEFVAKTLHRGGDSFFKVQQRFLKQKEVILATPLYVALVE